jgi:O-antigen ligase
MHLPAIRQNTSWLLPLFALSLIAATLIMLPMASALLLIGGVLALIAVLRVPELALYALIFSVPYGSWFPIAVGESNVTAVDLLVVVVLALGLARMIAKERAINIRWPPLSLPFAIFLFTALVSVTGALSFQFAMKEFAKWAEMFAVYLFVANNLDAQKTQNLLIGMLLAGLTQAAIGIYQFLFRAGPEGFILFDRFIRAYGTFEQPNPYAGYLGLVIPIALGVVSGFKVSGFSMNLKRETWKAETITLRVLSAVSLIVLSAALGMSWSRGAWIGVGAGLVATVVVQSRRAFVLTILGAGLLAFVIWLSAINIIPNAIAARFEGISDYFGVFDVRGVKVDDANFAVVERMAHWQAAWEMFSDHPLLGVGFGNYQVIYPVYALPRWSDPLGHAHNYYLNVAAEAGMVGLAGYVILWLAALAQGWRAVRSSDGIWRGIAAGCLGVLVALSIFNAFDDLFVHGMHVQVGIILGIVATIGMKNDQ